MAAPSPPVPHKPRLSAALSSWTEDAVGTAGCSGSRCGGPERQRRRNALPPGPLRTGMSPRSPVPAGRAAPGRAAGGGGAEQRPRRALRARCRPAERAPCASNTQEGRMATTSCEYLQDAGLETRGGQPVEMRCEPRSRIPVPDRAVTSAKGRAPGRPSAVRPRFRSQRRDAESYLYRRTPGGGACAGCGKDALGVDGSQVSPTDATPNHRLGTRLPPGALGAPTGGHSHGRCT